ncbi:hypothetical protein [Serratia marcescens]|uniref:hypothetical protein n=2 Tax=Serratia TaxID=613 RepID=UPI001020B5F5|nr:hypothetical protein [Serratia marcescens]MDS0825388.1 hypothetical protein [Serratia marcescens]
MNASEVCMQQSLSLCVQEIADVIGRERALYLIGQLPRIHIASRQYSKVILYVPKRLTPEHALIKILGRDDADKLVNAFGGENLHPGNCEYLYRDFLHRTIKRMRGEGVRTRDIAALLGMSERNVTRHKL